MDSRFNKTKSVKFDSTVRSDMSDTNQLRESTVSGISNQSSSIRQPQRNTHSNISKINNASSIPVNSDSDWSDEEYQQTTHSKKPIRRFIASENRQKEQNDELKASLLLAKQSDRTYSDRNKQIVEMISQKAIYNGGSSSNNNANDDDSAGINLEEKTFLEEAFFNFHDLMRKHRLKISQQLTQLEAQSSRVPSINVVRAEGMLESQYAELLEKRTNAWRGFIKRTDVHAVLRKFGFFENVTEQVFDRFAEKIKCVEKRHGRDWIFYSRLLASVVRYKSSISHLTKRFIAIDNRNGTKRMQTFRKFDELPAKEMIVKRYFEKKAFIQKRDDKRKANELRILSNRGEVITTEEEKIRTSMNESADNLIGILREKISQSQKSLKDIFKMLDSDNDSFISKAEFKLAFKKSGIIVDELILDEAYFRFDYNKDDQVSFNEFLSVILGGEKKSGTNTFQLQAVADDLVMEIRKQMHVKFSNRRLFLEALNARNPSKVSEDEFCSFLSSHANKELSRIHMKTVFSFLDQDGKRYLKSDEFLEIYEQKVQKDEVQQELQKEQSRKELEKKAVMLENSEFEAEAQLFYQSNISKQDGLSTSRLDYLSKLFRQNDVGILSEADEKLRKFNLQKLSRQPAEQIEEEIAGQERKLKGRNAKERMLIYLRRQIDLEKAMKAISDSVEDRIARTGKTLSDIFNLFAKKRRTQIDEEEFQLFVNFFCAKQVTNEVLKALFFLYASYYQRKLTISLFEKLISDGSSLNPLYLKFKTRFGNKLDKLKKRIVEDFQKLDVSAGKWVIQFDDFKKILELNQIQFSSSDEKQLVKDGILSQNQNNILVSYKKLIPIVFTSNTTIQNAIYQRHARIVTRLFKFFKIRKQRRLLEEAKKKANEKKDTKKKGSLSKSKERTTRRPLKKAEPVVEQPVLDTKKLGEFKRPKELTEFYIPEDSTNKAAKKEETQQSVAATTNTKQAGKVPVKIPLMSQLEGELPERKGQGIGEQQFQQQERSKTNDMCEDLLFSMIDTAVGFGESLILSKEIQKRYEERPVSKDVFICLKDLEAESIDILPHCIFTSAETGRIMALDKDSHLHQYDLVSKKKLITLDLSIKVPLKESALLGAAFDHNSGRLYLLTDKWKIEVWELGQDSSSPIGSIVLMSENIDTPRAVESSYPRRFQGIFPGFISMSEHSHQVIVVNSSCVNNSIILVDPISLCVINVIYVSPDDFHMSSRLNDIINKIAPKLLEIQQKGITFEEIFEGKIKRDSEEDLIVPRNIFQDAIFNYFRKEHPEFTYDDWGDLVNFLDQNSSGLIDSTEFDFLFEIIKYHSVRLPDSTEQLIKLAGISEGAFGLLNSFARFLQRQRKSIEDAFRAFDSEGVGMISCEDFEFILERICKDDSNLKYASELISFIDKDKNGSIDFSEFAEIFGIATDHQSTKIQFNGRKNLMLCIQKAFEGGIDVESMLIKADEYKEGTLSSLVFRNILKWLPIGITEDELDYIMNNSVTYSDNGGVNYMKLITSAQFRNIKDNYEFKKSMVNQKDFEEYKRSATTERREQEIITQKVIIETAIYLDDFDLLVYTTVCPRTSLIFVSKSNKSIGDSSEKSQQASSDFFHNKLLAKLSGHKTHFAPTIAYVAESGCLISGEKLGKSAWKEREDQLPTLNNASTAEFFDKDERGNLDFDRLRKADILIWNIQRDLLAKFETNPPHTITPTRVIESAHYDSVLSFTYLPYSQLIASSSADCTIKLWNPIARPYSLVNQDNEASVEIKPGYYSKRKQEFTMTNQPFCEVRRIYTGEQTCFGVSSFTTRIPVLSNPEAVSDNPGKRMNILEAVIACNLSKTELINKKPRNPSTIRVFSIDKMTIEVPCNRHDEVIPMKFYEQLESLALERRKKAYVNFQMYLPTQLEVLKSKKTLQSAALSKMVHLLKKVSLTRYDESQKYSVDEDMEQLFEIFTRLPSRQAFAAFLSDHDGKNSITANELFFYLKKFRSLHPLNMQRDKFFDLCKKFKSKAKKGLFITSSQGKNDLEKAFAESIRKQGLSIHEEFAKMPSASFEESRGIMRENIIISKSDFLMLIHRLGLFSTEQDFVLFMAQVDPLFSNKVSSSALEEKFSSDIIEFKLSRITKPKDLVESTLGKLGGKARLRLMFSLSSVESAADGYLSKSDFIFAFEQANIGTDKVILEEIFDFYAEKFSEEDLTKVLSIKYVMKKFFSPAENLTLAKYLHTLGKIKSVLLEQGYPIEFLYRPLSDDDVSSTSGVKSSKTDSSDGRKASILKKQPISSPLLQIHSSLFIRRAQQLEMKNISAKELQSLADFLSIVDEQQSIQLGHFLHFMRRTSTKDQYLLILEFKNIYNEINSLISKETELLEWKDRYNKVIFTVAEIRYILGKMDVSLDYLDDIIIQFLQDKNSIVLEELIEKFKEYVNQKPMLRNAKYLEQSILNTEEASAEANRISLGDVLFSQKGEIAHPVTVQRHQYFQMLVSTIKMNESSEKIESLIATCEQRDQDKKAEMEISTFCNILRFNASSVSEDLLINFQREFVLENDVRMIEYQEFFNRCSSDDQSNAYGSGGNSAASNYKEDVDVNTLMKRIVHALSESTVNLSYALKFIQNEQGMIPSQELSQLLELIKVNFSQNEHELLTEFLTENNSPHFIRSQYFLDQIYICRQGIANVFRLDLWKIALTQIEQITIDCAKTNIAYIERFVRQRSQASENSARSTTQQQRRTTRQIQPEVDARWPLVTADTFSKAIQEQLSHDFDNKQQGELVAFAIVGSQLNQEKAREKVNHISSNEFSIHTEIIHMGLFIKGLQEIFNYTKQQKKSRIVSAMITKDNETATPTNNKDSIVENRMLKSTQSRNSSGLPSSFDQSSVEGQTAYLIAKIKSTLKENGVSIWDALLSSNLTIIEGSKVPVLEFKSIINSLNLKLNLQEKQLLVAMADPSNQGKCDLNILLAKIEGEQAVSDRARYLILEKFSHTLFYNDLSLSKAFNLFDEDGDGIISFQEFVISMGSLTPGLNQFEILTLMNIIDVDQNQSLSKMEFIKILSLKNLVFKIEPQKEFQLKFLTKIRNMIDSQGADLKQAFEETDSQLRGYIYFKNLKDALSRFGLQNVKNFHVLTLYKIYLAKNAGQESGLISSPQKSQTNMGKSQQMKSSKGVSSMSEIGNDLLDGTAAAAGQSSTFLEDEFDIQAISDEKIDYKELCKRVLSAIDTQARGVIEQTDDLLRKFIRQLESKKVTLFEAFVHFDVNSTNEISELELRFGIKNFEIFFSNADFDLFFKAFQKTPSGKITFNALFNRFMESGAIQVIKFDDTLEQTLKKFAQKTTKLGNFEQAFAKMDVNGNGQVSVYEFKEACKRLSLGLKYEEVEVVFKSLLNVDTLNFRKHVSFQLIDQQPSSSDHGSNIESNSKTFKYRNFVKLLSQFQWKSQSEQVFFKLFKKSQERKIDWRSTFKQASSSASGALLSTRKPVAVKDPRKGTGANASAEGVTVDISLAQLKNMLNSLKLGLTFEEIDIIVNSFLTTSVSYAAFVEKTVKACEKLSENQSESSAQIQGILSNINAYLDKTRTKMSSIFKDFNNIELGRLRLSELNNIVRFMQIEASIMSIKMLFTALDVDGKEYITLNQINMALQNPLFAKNNDSNHMKDILDDQALSEQQRKDMAKLSEIKAAIKDKLSFRCNLFYSVFLLYQL